MFYTYLKLDVLKENKMYKYIICIIFKHNNLNHSFCQTIASLGESRQVLDCAWILISELDSISIKDKLVTNIGAENNFFISQLSFQADAAWLDLSQDVTKWLKSKL